MKDWDTIKVQDECLLCSKKFQYEEIVTIKVPEGMCICQPCVERIPDDSEYHWDFEWWVGIEYTAKDMELEAMVVDLEIEPNLLNDK